MKIKNLSRIWLFGLLMTVQTSVFAAKQPNMVLILADDLGFSDTQPYDGEINTPYINQLAKQGISFTNYHTAASF
ncbi:MAG: membrane-anchored protein YejM (alkaline phosphatase superfamily) [Paraglaciecola sp.]|jgi:membrane-anchored protein YejM (alkaline phosphatase superfamily)